MVKRTAEIRSDIAWSTPDRIVVRGRELTADIIGKVDLGGMAFLTLTGRLPKENEARLFNAIAVTLVEHGITPSVIAARMTYMGAPEAMQAAVGAGLAGLGSVFVGSIEGVARYVQEGLATQGAKSVAGVAASIVAEYRAAKRPVPGIGHNQHKGGDPRVARLFAIAGECGLAANEIALVEAVAAAAEKATGRSLPINATGAIGAISSGLGIPWKAARGIGVMARAIGLVGHLLEEAENPIAYEVWQRTEEEASAHLRPKG
jgi:citrate synthase